jgi:hypothetical protein
MEDRRVHDCLERQTTSEHSTRQRRYKPAACTHFKGEIVMRTLRGFVVAIAMLFFAQALAQTTTVTGSRAPGKGMTTETTRMTATVVAVDKASRDITLKVPQGNDVVVTAGPEVKNFDQIKVGDQVDVEYQRALALELKKGGGQTVYRADQLAAGSAMPGAMPAGAVGRRTTIVADVVAVDPAKQTITLKGPERTVDLVIADPEQFKRIAKGDQVEATFTQALAVVVSAKK